MSDAMICMMLTCMVIAPCMVARAICIDNDRSALIRDASQTDEWDDG